MQMAKIKMTAIIKCCRACGVTILSYTIDRKYKLMQTFGKWFGYEVEYIFFSPRDSAVVIMQGHREEC